jgi:hypothetical protein
LRGGFGHPDRSAAGIPACACYATSCLPAENTKPIGSVMVGCGMRLSKLMVTKNNVD